MGLLLCVAQASAQVTTTGILPGAFGWYLPTKDDAGELFVFEVGTGEPPVVLHGGPGADFTYMLPIARDLTTRFKFVFYDQRGSLRSRVTADSITMARHVEDLETLRLALNAERIRLVSHSAGTLLALEYLRTHPDRVGHLALIGALPHKNGSRYFDAEYAALWKNLADSMRAFQERPAVAAELQRAGVAQAATSPRDKAIAALIRQVGAETYHVERWRETIPIRVNYDASQRTRRTTNFEYDYGPLLSTHPMPVTVINGEHDYAVGPRGSPLWKRLAATVAPRVRVNVIPEASHIVWRDAPDEFREALLGALSGR
jgi:pimeloyl-ACP methyl ester carboxylesterase